MADPKMAEAPTGAKKTLVEEGTEFKGALTSQCPVVVSGKIDGEVNAPSLTVSASGSVHGKVKVSDIRSDGELAGEFDADNVSLSGRVNDNTVIRSKSLEVKLSTDNGKPLVAFGDCVLEVGEEPRKTAGGNASAQQQASAPAPAPAAPAPAAPAAPKAQAPSPAGNQPAAPQAAAPKPPAPQPAASTPGAPQGGPKPGGEKPRG